MNQQPPLFNPANCAFVEELYDAFLRDASSVSTTWRGYFENLGREGNAPDIDRAPSIEGIGSLSSDTLVEQQDRVTQLVHAYLVRGYTAAKIDPLEQPRPVHPELTPELYGFTEADLDRHFSTHGVVETGTLTLREILERLRATYCGSIGVQFMHIDDGERRTWLRQRMERTLNRVHLKRDEQIRILKRLTDAVIFEEFIQQKYPGAKSFSLEGAEGVIPLLDLAIETAGEHGVEEIVLAMAHRGRLNVLANIVGKRPREIFHEFEDATDPLPEGRGDVKYHLGHSTDWTTASGRTVHLSLCFNPSHLEFVNPVALGRVRAKQDRAGDAARERIMALLIHGDASFAGEGVVQESLNLSRLEGYSTGGALHVVINNQIGFTTSPEDARSSPCATDVAKMLQIPIFHVNGEDPEAVAQVVRFAMDFRRTFRSDVVIDMYCFRRHGHNEGDEPAFTHPRMYHVIEKRRPLREHYLDHLLRLGEVNRNEADRITTERRAALDQDLSEARSLAYIPIREKPVGIWTGYYGGTDGDGEDVGTEVEQSKLRRLIETLTRLPEGFHPHPKITQWLGRRRDMSGGGRLLDWATAETLAFATLAEDGVRVRLSGQDTARGTFSQRHAVLHDSETGRTYMPLQHLASDQAPVEIYNSPLSEAGVVGFEYGYSLDRPDGLVLWEAQFGDFVNAAQVIIDQFMVSAEEKWRRLSGLVILLPHGFEGQGPEHSSARLERFLELAVNDNLQIVNPTTPAQYFHALRRQALRRWRKPLVVMAPKSLLRHPQAVSPLEDLEQGRFRRILLDRSAAPDRVDRVLLCSGKIYYDLARRRDELKRTDVAIVRIEQLYPLHDDELREVLAWYPPNTPAVWVQEEPANMGAWRYLFARFGERLFDTWPFSAVCRPASASPATGWGSLHRIEQTKLLEAAFDVH
ncbi:MAG: 2-oxoglutarate dehydrogenase E1 component [Nitrospira sp.]|jgi:2-oxoglutarate dehydrogenase E1 component|nr:MAG: 2-oxoglutarate dehydrogenase E1 component [Nitrospira sp.]